MRPDPPRQQTPDELAGAQPGTGDVPGGGSGALTRRRVTQMLVAGAASAVGATWLGCGGDGAGPPDGGEATVQPWRFPLDSPRMVDTNGVTLAVYEHGEGPPVVLCHGFPELAYSWRNQFPALARAGYRAIAADQRGFGRSSRPAEVSAYTLEELCADMAGLLDALEIDRAVFCGHDWGGGVVWMMPRLYPDRVAGVIGVNTPTSHPNYPAPPVESLIVPSERFYQATFQLPGEAERVLEADVRRTFEFLMRRGGIWDVEVFSALPEDSPERRMDLLTLIEKGEPSGELLLSEEELGVLVETFERTGFTGGLNWYRAVSLSAVAQSVASWDIEVPSLYVGAEDDVILRPERGVGMAAFIEDFEHHTIADCGHWTQQERPEELNRVMIDWLDRKVRGA